MEEDDLDFTPSPNTNSNLASLFGFNKKPLKGNSSLTYTAPKAPRRDSSPAKKESPEPKSNRGKIICSKAVHVYKLENRTYVNQGLNGLVISGNQNSHSYDIILYKPTKEHISQTKISTTFSITISPNNYVSFYDNNKQNWSLMFQSPVDVEQFAQKIAVCKFYSHLETPDTILIQDLTPTLNPLVNSNNTVDVVYSSYSLDPEESSKLKGDIVERIKVSNHSFAPLSNGLVGCSENAKRVVIIPHLLSGPWRTELSANKDLLLEVKVEKIIQESEVLGSMGKTSDDCPESPMDSSAEEATIKARGASIKVALVSKKSQKASLISRMAKMGQATLPLQQGLTSGLSDSEEEGPICSSPKPRMPRSRIPASSPQQNVSISQPPQTHNPESSQQISVYHNDVKWQQPQKIVPQYQQLIPVSASPISSPTTDPSLSLYVSESRIQATELRMGISKISEKLDLVWNKVQNLNLAGGENKAHQPPVMDSGGILSSIQSLITENENLKEKVQEQKGKIEQQNDRIYNLLELNHKYLEQSSTSHDKQSESESKLKFEIETLRKREADAEADHKRTSEKAKVLESELAKSEDDNKQLRRRIEEMGGELERFRVSVEGSDDLKRKELEMLTEKLSRASEAVMKLKERLREVISENENLKSVIKVQKEEIETGSQEVKDSKVKNEEFEKTVESLKKQISVEEAKTESKIDKLSRTITELEEEKKQLEEKLQKAGNEKNIKSVLDLVTLVLRDQFPDTKEYRASVVLSTVDKTFKDAINGTLSSEKKPEVPATEAEKPVVPAPRTSLQSTEPAVKEGNKSEAMGNDAESTNPPRQKEAPAKGSLQKESPDSKSEDTRFKSYDQGWRPTKPPPPPLFDDEDDDDNWLN